MTNEYGEFEALWHQASADPHAAARIALERLPHGEALTFEHIRDVQLEMLADLLLAKAASEVKP
jgi:hypothetical protein